MLTWIVVCAVTAEAAAGGNLLPNGSFEVCRNFRHITGSAGWGRFQMTDPRTLDDPTLRTWYVDDTTAWHGKKSLCVYQYVESQFVLVKPGRDYTISLHAKAGKPVKVRLSFQSGERTAYVPDGPVVRKEFQLAGEWQRLVMTGSTEGAEPCAYALYIEVHGDKQTPVWIDAVQIEEGGRATAFAPKHRVEVADQIIDERPSIGIYFRDEAPRMVTSVFADGSDSGRVELVHRVLGHRDREIDRIEQQVTIGRDGSGIDEMRLPFRRHGAFRVETDVALGKARRSLAAEAIFAFVPRVDPRHDDPGTSRFGSRFLLPPFPREGARRFLPSWIGGESEVLRKAGAKPPYNHAVVTASQARRLGIRWVRWSPGWHYVETKRGRFDWSEADNYFDALGEMGWRVQACFASSPRWSHPAQPDGRAPPDDVADWENWLRTYARRYKGRFHAVEVWNESFSNFLGTADQYAKLLETACTTLKREAPDVKVLGISGCRPSYAFRMTKQVLARVGTKYMGAMSYHQKVFGEMPDEMTIPWEVSLQKLHAAMAAKGGDRPIWNTEFQIWTEPFYKTLVRGAGGHSRTIPFLPVGEAPAGLVRAVVVSIANGVARFQYFGTYNARGSVITSWSGQDLLDFPLTESLYEPDYSPRPLAAAHAALAAQLASAEFKQEMKLTDDGRGRAFLFDGGRGPLAILWAKRARTRNGTLDWGSRPAAVRVHDVMGNPIEGAAKMVLGAEPIYVRADSMAVLKGALTRATVADLPAIDRISDVPDVVTCLRSADESGGLELVLRVINATGKTIKPTVDLTFADDSLTAGPPAERADSIEGSMEGRFRFPLVDRARPSSRVNGLTVRVGGAAKEVVVNRPIAIAYALRAAKPIRVDGKLDEWTEAGAIRIGEKRQVAPGLTWGGTEDLSAAVRLRWDATSLYDGLHVVDDHVDRHASPGRLWDGTCVELFFDVDLLRDAGVGDYNQDDFHFQFAPASGADRGDAFAIADRSGTTRVPGIRMRSGRTDVGYDMEIALPRAVFDFERWLGGAGKKFEKGHSFGFGLTLNDSFPDRTARKTMLIWGGTVDNWRDISGLATVVMVEDQ